MSRLLVVDDDLSIREFLELMLVREGYEVQVASGGKQALDLIDKEPFDLVITDIRMEQVDGIEVLKGVKARRPDTVVILISAFATIETAVAAMKEGAYDFFPKPFNIDEIKAVIRSALEHRTPENEKRVLEAKVKKGCHFGSLVGVCPPMLKVYDLIRRAAQTPTNILISGESGTGKELVARAIHENSPRSNEKFVAINCGGMPEQLIESELFGYRKGAFTGAAMDKQGLFELAHKGTIFLDEIGELSLPMQVKLLRVVQDKTYRALGDTRERVLDVRFIAATNKNLEAEVMAGRFREDLYYRLNVINIHLPPLRTRKEDIPLLAHFFLEKYSRSMDKDLRKISAFALEILSNYHFPGNVRELENIIERSVALEQSSIVLPESLTLASFKTDMSVRSEPDAAETQEDEPPLPAKTVQPAVGLDDVLETIEQGYLIKALHMSRGVKHKTAELLGISSWRLRGRLKKHGLHDAGEVRIVELAQNTVEVNVVPEHLTPPLDDEGMDLDRTLLRVEKYLVEKAIDQADGSKTRAAEILGFSPRTLHSRLSRIKKLKKT